MKAKKKDVPEGSVQWIVERMQAVLAILDSERKAMEDLNQRVVAKAWEIDRLEKEYLVLQNDLTDALKKEITPLQAPQA